MKLALLLLLLSTLPHVDAPPRCVSSYEYRWQGCQEYYKPCRVWLWCDREAEPTTFTADVHWRAVPPEFSPYTDKSFEFHADWQEHPEYFQCLLGMRVNDAVAYMGEK